MSVTDPTEPPTARVCAGVDWAKDDHAVCVVDPDGERCNGSSSPTTRPG